MADASAPVSGGGSQPSTILRNIIVGAITTVLGSTTVYFITHGKDKTEPSATEKLLVGKEVTTKAWKSYVAMDNIYYKNVMGLSKEMVETKNIINYKNEVLKEAESFKKDVENILKDPNLDNSFSSLLNRRLDREKESVEKLGAYIDRLEQIRNMSISDQEKMQRLQAEDNGYRQYSMSVLARATTEVEDLAKNLTDKYAQPFNVEEFLAVVDYKKLMNPEKNKPTVAPGDSNSASKGTPVTQVSNPEEPAKGKISPDNIITPVEKKPKEINNPKPAYSARNFTGEWNAAGALITLSPDGEMGWEMPNGDYVYGTWRFANNQILMNATYRNGQRANWVFNLSKVTTSSFTMQLAVQPYNLYYLVKNMDY